MVSKIEALIVLAAILSGLGLFSTQTLALNATRTDATNAISQSQQDMNEMLAAGLSINSINDSITAANQALERADFAELIKHNATGELAETAREALEGLNYEGFTYDEVLKYTQEVTSRKLQAYNVSDSLRAVEIKIGEYQKSINVSDVENILENARTAFGYERYDEATALISQANDMLDSKKAELATFNILVKSGKSFLEKNWRETIIVAAIAFVCGYFGWRRYNIRRIENRLKKLKAEKGSLTNLMKKAQVERYDGGKLSGLVYNMRMEKYSKKLNEIKANIPVLEAMLERKKMLFKNISEKEKKERHRKKR
jgi:hypothetical protein